MLLKSGTLKYVGAPFSQLWSICVFLQHGDSVNQVPFALMSGASTEGPQSGSRAHYQ